MLKSLLSSFSFPALDCHWKRCIFASHLCSSGKSEGSLCAHLSIYSHWWLLPWQNFFLQFLAAPWALNSDFLLEHRTSFWLSSRSHMLHGLEIALKRKDRKLCISSSSFPLCQRSYCLHFLPAFGCSSVPQAVVFYISSRVYNCQWQEDYSGICYSPLTKSQKHTFSINCYKY